MALWPSQRQSKKKSEEESAVDELDDVAQFFSNDPRPGRPSPDDARPIQATVGQMPAVTMPDHAEAGWYPDTTTPELMRYWDGFHLTGQTMQVEPTASRADEPVESAPDTATVTIDELSVDHASWSTDLQAPTQPQAVALADESLASAGRNENGVVPPPHSPEMLSSRPRDPAPVAVTSLELNHGPSELHVSDGETWTVMGGVGEAKALTEENESSAALVAAIVDDGDGGNRRASLAKVNSDGAQLSQAGADMASNWAEETEKAVARAQTVGTPEAWQAAAQAAVVVSEMAQSMEAAADAMQTAEQTGKAAQEAEEAAKVAAEAAADAKRTVQLTGKAAQEAEEAAKVAAEAAADAKKMAEQTAQAAPQVAEVARVAAQRAADAKHKAEGLEVIVAKARAANTPAAWTDALELTAVATEAQQELVSGG